MKSVLAKCFKCKVYNECIIPGMTESLENKLSNVQRSMERAMIVITVRYRNSSPSS